MQADTVSLLMKTIDAQFTQLGFRDWDEGISFARRVLTQLCEMLLSRAQLEEHFIQKPEPSPEELDRMLSQVKGMSSFFRKNISPLAKKEIPPDRGGRPSVLGTRELQAQRIQHVLALIGKKVSTTDALKQVAKREGISLSSMQRIWKKRGE